MRLVLGVSLGALVSFPTATTSSRRATKAVRVAFASYTDAAIMLAFSIQLASLVLLVKKDYSISAAGFGTLTIEVTWAAALLTMLPLAMQSWLDVKEERPGITLVLISISWVFFMFTFLSRMALSFGPSQVGSGSSDVLTITQWSNIEYLCFKGISQLDAPSATAFDIFAIGGSVLVSLAILGKLIRVIMCNRMSTRAEAITQRVNLVPRWVWSAALISNVVLWGEPQVWAIFEFRGIQQKLAAAVNGADQDGQWSFGQIIAGVVFLPVFVDLVYGYFEGREDQATTVVISAGK